MAQVSYLKLQKKYGGQFIARRGRQVLAHAKSMGGLFKILRSKGISYGPSIRIARIHPADAVCIYVLPSN